MRYSLIALAVASTLTLAACNQTPIVMKAMSRLLRRNQPPPLPTAQTLSRQTMCR